MLHDGWPTVQDPDTGSRVTIDFQYGAGAAAGASVSVVSVSECSGESGALVPDGLITTARESERFYRADNK